MGVTKCGSGTGVTEALASVELVVVTETKWMKVPLVVEVYVGPGGAEQMGSRKL